MQINVTEKAIGALKKLLAMDQDKQAIYVYLAGIGCGGGGTASFSLVPVEQKNDENGLEAEGLTFFYDRLILFHTQNLLIDYKQSSYDKEIRLESFIIKDAT